MSKRHTRRDQSPAEQIQVAIIAAQDFSLQPCKNKHKYEKELMRRIRQASRLAMRANDQASLTTLLTMIPKDQQESNEAREIKRLLPH